MKKMLALAMLLAAVILGAYYGMGYVTEHTLKKNIALMSQTDNVSVEMKSYQRGWFHSVANLVLNVHFPAHEIKSANGQMININAQNYLIDLPLRIKHGPIIVVPSSVRFGLGYAETTVDVPVQYASAFAKFFTKESTKPHLHTTIFVSYLNSTHVTFDVPAFKLVAQEDNSQLVWQGLNGRATISSGLKRISGDIKIQPFEFSKDKSSLALGESLFEYHLQRSTDGLYLGDADVNLPSFVLSQDGQKTFELQQVVLHSNSGAHDGLFNSSLNATLAKMVSEHQTYGPGILTMAIKNLDEHILVEINQKLNQLHQGTAQEKQQVVLQLLPQLPKLFAQGATFELTELSFTMPQGTVEADLTLSFPKSASNDNPFQMAQNLQGEGALKVPAPVLKDMLNNAIRTQLLKAQTAKSSDQANKSQATAEQQTVSDESHMSPQEIEQNAMSLTDKKVSQLVQSGVIVERGEDYLISVNLSKGELLVNGKPFNRAMLGY